MGYIGAGISRFNTADELTVTGDAEFNGNANFGDSDKAQFGAGSDLQIYHDSSNSYVKDAGTGDLLVQGTQIKLQDASGNDYLRGFTGGSVYLHHAGNSKFETTSTGVAVTGNATFADNGKAIFGAGSDLEIYHDGSNSFVVDNGTGGLQLRGSTFVALQGTNGENGVLVTENGSAQLRFNNSPKLETTATGATISGDLLVDGADPEIVIQDTNDTGDAYIRFKTNSGTQRGFIQTAMTGNVMLFGTGTTESMRINSAGALLIGKTSDSISNNGISAAGSATGGGHLSVTNDGNSCVTLNRKTSDGTIMSFATDGTTGGSIGVLSDRLCVGQSDVALFFDATNNTITPFSFDTFDTIDNHIDLGIGSRRFQDIFATNGTIQTSDANEKQDIASLTSTEITAAKAISALFKTYKWKAAAASKGDAARIHTGVIAQEVQTAMSDAGLDAANYAFWCSDTWWETSTDVPAVEAVDEVLDEYGNVITEAVEAKDAYTRIDTYHTADEAPDGATQRTRMGIRYPELLAFIGAATEQRLTDIESRIATLEAK